LNLTINFTLNDEKNIFSLDDVYIIVTVAQYDLDGYHQLQQQENIDRFKVIGKFNMTDFGDGYDYTDFKTQRTDKGAIKNGIQIKVNNLITIKRRHFAKFNVFIGGHIENISNQSCVLDILLQNGQKDQFKLNAFFVMTWSDQDTLWSENAVLIVLAVVFSVILLYFLFTKIIFPYTRSAKDKYTYNRAQQIKRNEFSVLSEVVTA